MKHMKYLAVFLSFVYVLSIGNYVYANNILASTKRMLVVEWDVVSPDDVNIPKLSKMQLLSEIKKSIKTQRAFYSWEAKYNITSRQSPQKLRDRTIPEIITCSQVHMISNGSKWFCEKLKEIKDKTTNKNSAVNTRFVSNGEIISMVWPDSKNGQVQSVNKAISVSHPTLADFLPSLPSELPTRTKSFPGFPEVLDILEASDTKLLPWYTRVNNQICYVLEQKTTLQHPLFRNKEEVESWKKANPKEAEAWSKAARHGLVLNIYPSGGAPWFKPGEIREIETKIRIAIAPQLGFSILRWAYGYGTYTGIIQGHIFPKEEIKYSDFHKIGRDIFVPKQMVHTKYGFDHQEQRRITHETQLLLEEFVVDRQYNSEFFEVHFPVGYRVVDADRGISYVVGDSEEKISTLVTAAKAREDFYDRLRSKDAPDLEYSKWINGKPIRLADHKGRPIILHFWGLGCAPCMHKLPMLQKQYGQTLERTSAHLFISIHPFVENKDLKQLEETIKKKGISFPVMVDAPDLEGRSWGKTFKKYMVFGIPTEVKIDKNGHFAEIDKDITSNTNLWINKPEGSKN